MAAAELLSAGFGSYLSPLPLSLPPKPSGARGWERECERLGSGVLNGLIVAAVGAPVHQVAALGVRACGRRAAFDIPRAGILVRVVPRTASVAEESKVAARPLVFPILADPDFGVGSLRIGCCLQLPLFFLPFALFDRSEAAKIRYQLKVSLPPCGAVECGVVSGDVVSGEVRVCTRSLRGVPLVLLFQF